MLLEQGHDAPAHVATESLVGNWYSRCCGSRRRGTAGHIEEALVLLLQLLEHL